MAKSRRSNKKSVFAYVGIVLTFIVVVGLVIGLTNGFMDSFANLFVKVNGEIIISDKADYTISKANPLIIETDNAEDYVIDIKANELVSFNYSTGDGEFQFNNSLIWKDVFVIDKVENGFVIYPVADALDALIATCHGVENVYFNLPSEAPNLFCLTISHIDKSKQYKIYFSLAQVKTLITLDKKEILF